MSEIYESIMRGLQEAVEDAAGRRKLPREKIEESSIPQSHAGRRGAGASCNERGCAKNE